VKDREIKALSNAGDDARSLSLLRIAIIMCINVIKPCWSSRLAACVCFPMLLAISSLARTLLLVVSNDIGILSKRAE